MEMTARSRGSSRTARCEEAIRGVGSVFSPSGDHGGDEFGAGDSEKAPRPFLLPTRAVCLRDIEAW